MKKEEDKFNEVDSIRTIKNMLSDTRDSVQHGVANTIVFAGYSVAIVAIINYLLLLWLNNPYKSYLIWLTMIPVGIICFLMNAKRSKNAWRHNYVSRVLSSVWVSFAVSVILGYILIYLVSDFYDLPQFRVFITPMVLILAGTADYVTAITTRFNYFFYGAYTCWIGAVVTVLLLFITESSNEQFLVFAFCILAGFVLPGHMLNQKAKNNV